MVARLHITDGERSWTTTLDEEKISFGRDPNKNAVPLKDDTVSRIHATLKKNEKGYAIIDHDSKNGVWVNRKRLSNDQPHLLEHGDRIALGAVELIYEWVDDLSDRVVAPKSQNLCEKSSANYEISINEKYAKVRTLVDSTTPMPQADDRDEFVELRSDRFRIRFFIRRNTDWLTEIYRTLERAYNRVGERLNYYPREVPVEVYATDSELIQAGRREGKQYVDWAAAVYDGVIRIKTSARALPTPETLYIILTHEYVHFVVDSKTGGRCPCWLNEGIAQAEAEVLMPQALRRLADAISNRTLPLLNQLERPFAELRDEERIRLAYLQSHAAVEWFVQRYGWEGVRHLLSELSNGAPIEVALDKLNLDYQTLEAMWQRWVLELTNVEMSTG